MTSRSELEARKQTDLLLATNARLLDTVAELSYRLESHPHYGKAHSSQPSIVSDRDTEIFFTPRASFDAKEQNDEDELSMLSVASQHPFEITLASSLVYRVAERGSVDFTARPKAWTLKSSASSTRSHAWSALTSVSLSQISSVSLVALLISWSELTDEHAYGPQANRIETANLQPSRKLNTTWLEWEHPQDLDFRHSLTATNGESVKLKLMIIGSSGGMPRSWSAAVSLAHHR